MFKVGDEVILFGFTGENAEFNGKISTIASFKEATKGAAAYLADGSYHYLSSMKLTNKGAFKMFGTIGSDLKVFIKDHKSSIYMVAVLLLADHLIFEGAFRVRLQSIMSNLLAKVEKAVGGNSPEVAPSVSLVADKKA